MKFLHRVFVGAAIAAALFAAAVRFDGVQKAAAQAGNYLLTTLTGSEVVAVDNGGPLKNAVTTNTLRNTTGYQLSSTASGTVVTTVNTNNLIFTAALTGAVTADLPPNPPDGQLFSVSNGTGSAYTYTITVAATDSSTIVNGSTAVNLAAAGSEEWQYTAAAAKWYRQR